MASDSESTCEAMKLEGSLPSNTSVCVCVCVTGMHSCLQALACGCVHVCMAAYVYMYALMCAKFRMWVGVSGVFIIVKHIWDKIY